MEKVKEIVRDDIYPREVNGGKSCKYAVLQVFIHIRAISAFDRTSTHMHELSLVFCP